MITPRFLFVYERFAEGKEAGKLEKLEKLGNLRSLALDRNTKSLNSLNSLNFLISLLSALNLLHYWNNNFVRHSQNIILGKTTIGLVLLDCKGSYKGLAGLHLLAAIVGVIDHIVALALLK